ncbi:MAG: response regulator [Chthoniobacteraceae bacterium]
MNIDPITHIARDARILIVDDDRNNVSALGQILSRAGYAICISITDPRKAAAKFHEMQPDLLLLDWHMGEWTGLDVLNEIRTKLPEELMPPIVVLTADDSCATKREALTAGVTDFLSKPLDISEVLLRIHNLLLLRMFRLNDEIEKRSLEDQVRDKTKELERALTDLRESQHQVIQQERLRALGEMAGGIAHDFNNVLTVISGYSDMFTEKENLLAHPDAALEAFRIIGKGAADSAEIVRRLRGFYRPYQSGEDDHRPVNLTDIVEEAVQLTMPRWKTQPQANGVFFDVKTEFTDVPVINGSASELREVLMNLIFNAVDAMPQGGQIVIRTGLEEDRVFFEVEDAGTGMTEETRRHCLEPFFTTKGDHGTGLGLSTTYGIVRRHEGIIRLDSQVNHGSRFTILLPIGKSVENTGAVPSENATPATGQATGAESKPHIDSAADQPASPLRVLVVDDQPDICNVMRSYLEKDAHTVETASDGCEALEKFQKERFDIVITDRAMPRMNGDQLAVAIKQIAPSEKIILLTAYSAPTETFSPDIDLLIDKPPSLQKIRQAINRVMAA